MADANGDGWPDLYVTRLDASDILFINQGDGTFVDGSEAAGLTALTMHTNGAWWGNIDNDGDADLFVTTIAESAFLLLINDARVASRRRRWRGAPPWRTSRHGRA